MEELKQIEANYNMGFIGAKEYYCQNAHVKACYGGKFYQFVWWRILCVLPKQVHEFVMNH